MNITELARTLRVTPNELRQIMPDLGFDIGQKAIKINGSIANKIIKAWPSIKRKIEQKKQEEEIKSRLEKKARLTEEKRSISLPNYISIRDFAALSELPLNIILSELIKNGVFASLNEKIDYDTAWLVGTELGLEIKRKEEESNQTEESRLAISLKNEKTENLSPRAPVIVVMGHVDHGKTKLLDAIRQSRVVEGEAGGITQHIGAYQAKHKGQLITFIDTPGHEAFTAMRSRGARIADIAILVVAADDGVKPQTIEAFRIIESAKIPFVVAINKIDKPDANIDKVKQELSNILKIVPEDWGGKTVCAPISALKNTGIDDLLDMVLLSTKTETESISANPSAPAIGTIIESHIDKGAGPIATILIQNGTLRVGDRLMLGKTDIGKVKCLIDYRGKKISAAEPSTPAQILGLKNSPQIGDVLEAGYGEKSKFKKNRSQGEAGGSFSTAHHDEEENTKKICLIIKSDVLGSAEAIEESLVKQGTTGKVRVKIIHKGLGNISDGDIRRAETCGAKIIGFNVKIPANIQEQAREKGVSAKLYSIIYDVINDVVKDMEAALEPSIIRVELGRLKVLAVFRTDKDRQIVGGKILDGQAEKAAKIEILRNKELIGNGELVRLQSGKQDVNSCPAGEECGLEFKGKPLILEGDILNFHKEEKIINKL